MKGYQALSQSARKGSWIKRRDWHVFVRVSGLGEQAMLEYETSGRAPLTGVSIGDLIAEDWQVKPRTVSYIDAQIAKLEARKAQLMKGAK